MKSRHLVTRTLILALALLPYRPARAQQRKPGVFLEVCAGMIVIGIGAWVGYSIYKMCQKIPPANPPPDNENPPPAPNFAAASTNAPTPTMQLTDDSGVTYWDCSGLGWVDPMTGEPVTQLMATRIQATADFQTWTEEASIRGYCSSSGITLIFSQGGTPVCTNYHWFNTTNTVYLGGTLAPHKFYRLAAP